jgi:hypothetical protein
VAREVVTKIYQISELSDKAKEKAIAAFRDVNTDHDWWESDYEFGEEEIRERLGIEKAEILFSGLWSQGDGASFTGWIGDKWIVKFVQDRKDDFPALAAAFDADDPQVEIYSAKVERFGSLHNVHERSCKVSLDVRASRNSEIDEKEIGREVDRLESTLDEIRLDLCREIYSYLEKDHEYLTSDEAIIETIEINEYEFDENGNFPPRCAS